MKWYRFKIWRFAISISNADVSIDKDGRWDRITHYNCKWNVFILTDRSPFINGAPYQRQNDVQA